MPYLGGFLIDLLVNWDFQLAVNSKHSIYICHILLTLNVRNFRIEHAT